MATAEVEVPPPALPDYLLDPNAVLKDYSAKWRYGQAPDYSNTRKVYDQSKCKHYFLHHRSSGSGQFLNGLPLPVLVPLHAVFLSNHSRT